MNPRAPQRTTVGKGVDGMIMQFKFLYDSRRVGSGAPLLHRPQYYLRQIHYRRAGFGRCLYRERVAARLVKTQFANFVFHERLKPASRLDLEPQFLCANLERHFAANAARNPELHLRADRATRYENVADILAAAQRAGINRIAFVTEPKP